ncbi:MAG: hypothetical protein L3J63_10160 [Geopsychrobacter sp.]|nr:hypothetical protein [Geopsychrobacter sp.]
MMRVELNNVEEKVLAETLKTSLGRLTDEISHTDSHDYREFLKERREILTRLSEKLH